MIIKEKFPVIITCCLIFCVIYFFFAISSLGDNLSLTPQWTINISPPVENIEKTDTPITTSLDNRIPFKLGQNLGYFTPEGIITYLYSFPYKATISSNIWTYYSSDASFIEILSSTGVNISKVQGVGFPYFEEDRVYLFHPGGSSVSQYSINGTKMWSTDNYVPIISFSSSSNGAIIGYADGKVLSMTPEGNKNVEFYPSGSNYEIIFGVDISESGEYLACISGLDKQRIIIIRSKNGQNRIVFHQYLENQCNKQNLVYFTKNDENVFFAGNSELQVVNCTTFESHNIVIKGKILTITETADTELVLVLSKDNDLYTVTLLEDVYKKTGSFSFKAENAFLITQDNSVFLGKDSQISRFDVSRN
jgi:hypothetical protein